VPGPAPVDPVMGQVAGHVGTGVSTTDQNVARPGAVALAPVLRSSAGGLGWARLINVSSSGVARLLGDDGPRLVTGGADLDDTKATLRPVVTMSIITAIAAPAPHRNTRTHGQTRLRRRPPPTAAQIEGQYNFATFWY
jgi:hypothetical protein